MVSYCLNKVKIELLKSYFLLYGIFPSIRTLRKHPEKRKRFSGRFHVLENLLYKEIFIIAPLFLGIETFNCFSGDNATRLLVLRSNSSLKTSSRTGI